ARAPVAVIRDRRRRNQRVRTAGAGGQGGDEQARALDATVADARFLSRVPALATQVLPGQVHDRVEAVEGAPVDGAARRVPDDGRLGAVPLGAGEPTDRPPPAGP